MSDSASVDVLTDKVPKIACSNCSHHIDVSALEPFTKISCPKCDTEQAVPAMLGSFLLVDLLGKGGMGAVYRAYDQNLGRYVGLKVMQKSLGDDPEFLATFRREAQAAAALNHANVCQIYSFGQEKGQPYIVMELIDGGALDHMMAAGRTIHEATIMEIGADVAAGLMAADEVGLVHGDIKPGNILLNEDGRAKVVDFGLASLANQAHEGGAVWGTPYYIPPEKVKQQPTDARSDMYSLGATLYHALALAPPFEGKTAVDVVKARLDTPPPDIREARPSINPNVADVITRMIQEDPYQRHPTYKSLIADMKRALETVDTSRRVGGRTGRNIVLAKGKTKTRKTSGPKSISLPKKETSAVTQGRQPLPPKKPVSTVSIVVVASIITLIVLGLGVGGVLHTLKKKRVEDAQQAEIDAKLAVAREKTQEYFDLVNKKVEVVKRRVVEVTNATAGIFAVITDIPTLAGDADKAQEAAEAALAALMAVEKAEASAAKHKATADGTDVTPDVARQANALAALVGELAPMPGELTRSATNMAALLVAATAEREKYLADQLKQEEDRKIREAEEAKRIHDAELAAAKQAAEVDRVQNIQAELDDIAAAQEKALRLIARYDYQRAIGGVKLAIGHHRTDEAKKVLAAVLERYQELVNLKAFLIKEINAKPFRSGWGPATAASDIVGASEEGLRVANTVAPWRVVSPQQMARIMGNYIKPVRQYADEILLVGIYHYENGNFALAEKYAAKACELKPALCKRSDDLMPDLLP